ncbi:MAG TPA: hypothetical protein VEA80_16425 [Vitreimonas sp.]|uniref:hypothetical protein n=1 Tax=Vitreimonas sp. TaxID=3069702 RepID=UPI002D6458BE|nr:hypothetical protein [Vitreimonas sp.]HYD89064.1 hypothetical protein [Vitreimonas sp.]
MRPIRTFVAAFAAAWLAAGPAFAAPSEVSRAIPGARQVGEARYQVLSVTLFEAELWTQSGAFAWDAPFALSLTYERSARASTLINRSISEMRGRGAGSAQALAPLRAQFQRCFPDVARGDRITGVSTGANTARFYRNGAHLCDIEWPGFRRHFFGIWLAGRDGAAARLSAELRGEA